MTDESQDSPDGIRALVIRIARYLVVVPAISIWIAWIIGGFGTLVVHPPLSINLPVSVTIDKQGVMIQNGRFFRTSSVVFQRQEAIPWQAKLSDSESTWITPWIVYCAWTSGMFKYRLIGLKFGLLLPLSLVVLAIRYWSPSNRNHQNQLTNAEDNSVNTMNGKENE